MKKRNYIAAIMLASLMATSAGFAAFPVSAADDYTVTITKPAGDTAAHTYEAYQVFSGKLTSTGVLSNIAWGDGVNRTTLLAALKADSTNFQVKKPNPADGTQIITVNAFADCEEAADVAEVIDAWTYDDTMLQKFADIVSKNLTDTKVSSDAGTLADPGTNSATTGVLTIDDEKPGYYFIKDTVTANAETVGSNTRYILKVVSSVTIGAKEDVPSSEKTVTETDDTTSTETPKQKVADYDIGDSIPYELTFTLPSNYADYVNYPVVFTDDMCAGLTWGSANTATGTIYFGNSDTTGAEITFTGENSTTYIGGKKWTSVSVDLKDHTGLVAGDVVRVVYNATLNSSAALNSVGNPNKYHVTFYNNPNVSTTPTPGDNNPPPTPPTDDTPDDTTVVFTYELVFNKVDEKNDPLNGAGFTLYKNVGGTWIDVTSLNNGIIAPIDVNDNSTPDEDTTSFSFRGLDSGEYKLSETKTPDGYNTISDITFTVVADKTGGKKVVGLSATDLDMTAKFDTDDAKLTATIKNQQGTTLPSTGGIGTTIFYVVGGTLVLGAVVLLITKKRMSVDDEK